ncbi:hypothetical protein [Arthrobacter sp. SLBN-83]|uniref:hypothetical protein n=1 Tax=Arthrobacter sp. SLBN-83 TaxID=2768449 RepID=UPI00114F4259|nr:hypothetical protein [Arthrobacter sp. SLBN-83]
MLVVVASLAILLSEQAWVGVIGLGASIGVIVAAIVPVRFLPGLAFATFLLLPITYMPQVNPFIGRYLSPALFFLVVWFIRSRRTATGGVIPKSWLFLAILLLGWAVLSFIWSIDSSRSIAWTGTVACVFLGPALMARRAETSTVAALSKSWLWIGLFLSAMAVAEGLTSTSFLGSLYSNTESGAIGFNQVWSESRATTTLGHPLMNATFFATTAAYAIMNSARTKSRLSLYAGAACTAGSVFTVSRSAVTALAVGLVVGVVAVAVTKAMSFGRKTVWTAAAVCAGLVVMNSPLIAARSQSAEGDSSSVLRAVLLDAAIRISGEGNFIGAGAGASQSRATMAGMTLPFENSYAGVLVSLGGFGVAVFALLIAGLVLTGIRRGLPEVAAATTAFGVQIAAYPLVDNVPVALIVLGVLAYLGFGGGNFQSDVKAGAANLATLRRSSHVSPIQAHR